MIKKRRRMDKNKRRCLLSAGKKATADPVIEDKVESPIVNNVEPPTKKKSKKRRIVDIKMERESIEKSNLVEESKPKGKSVKESTDKKEIEQPMKVSTEDMKVEVPKPKSKPLTKTKQRYYNYYILLIKLH